MRRHAQVRGEFEVQSDGAMVFTDAALAERDVAREV